MQTTSRGKPRRRISLSSHKADIERWVEEGRTDEWIAYALGTSRSSVQSFRSRSGIYRRNRAAFEEADEKRQDSPGEASVYEGVVYEGVLEHGEQDGYGLWIDPAVADDPVFQKGFARVSDINVTVEEGRIVLEPATETENGSASAAPAATELSSQLEMVFGGNAVSKNAGGAPASGEEQGKVKFFDDGKGYGFIYRPDGRQLFFHKSEIRGDEELRPGSEVVYEIGSNQRGLAAKDVRKGK